MSLTNVLLCLIALESGGDPNAKNDDCWGVLGIRPVFVEDVNRILGRQQFSLEDRLSRVKSLQMARIWFRHYEKTWWTLTDYALSFKMGISGYMKAKSKGTLSAKDLDYDQRFLNLMEVAE